MPHIPINLRTRQRDTLDSAVEQHLEWLSLNWKSSLSSSLSQHGQKAQPGGALHLRTIDGKKGTLMDGKTKKMARSVTTSTTPELRTD